MSKDRHDASERTVQPQAPKPAIKPSREAIWRSVASSTALATGQSVAELEAKLRNPSKRFAHIKLAR